MGKRGAVHFNHACALCFHLLKDADVSPWRYRRCNGVKAQGKEFHEQQNS